MRKTLVITLGVVMVIVGAFWTLQGLGVVSGSAMSGQQTWAVVGPIVAGFGVALAFLGARGSSHS